MYVGHMHKIYRCARLKALRLTSGGVREAGRLLLLPALRPLVGSRLARLLGGR
jgi:hypothetical protein